MEPFKTRGYILPSTLRFIREELDPARRDSVMKALSPETIRACENARAVDFYPIDKLLELVQPIVEAGNGDQSIVERDLVGVGRQSAIEATNTFLRLLMRVLSPALFAKKLPTLYARDNTRGKVTVEVGNDGLVCRLEDLGGFRHGCPIGLGFATLALEAMGKKITLSKAHVWTLDNPAPDSCWFELRWKT